MEPDDQIPNINARLSDGSDPSKEFYLVIDFEANCSDRGIRDHEIIEFPAVLVNAKTGETIAEFGKFVKMVTHKKVSKFIIWLTTITDDDLKTGVGWKTCLIMFEEWCIKNNITHLNTTVITCGDWDLKNMLPRQLAITKTKLSPILKPLLTSWTNIKVYYSMMTGKRGGMNVMLKNLKIPLVGHHHRGIDDSRNIAKICKELVDAGYDVTEVTNYL